MLRLLFYISTLPLLVVCLGACLGPGHLASGWPPRGFAGPLPNPLPVPVSNHDVVWDQLVDIVDDYFRVEHEQRVRILDDVLTEGRIETFPVGGATLLEPHRRDSVGRYNRLESSLQTIRRRASLRVIPAADSYLVEVRVEKELENVTRPERATTGAATFRNDDAIDADQSRDRDPALGVREELDRRRWIPKGRDTALEQEILAKIVQRIGSLANSR